MGKTYRKDKVYRKPRLNSHRDLPDLQHDLLGEEELNSFDEEYYYEQLHSKEQVVERPEDEPSGQTDKG